jgi:hypothetical protein
MINRGPRSALRFGGDHKLGAANLNLSLLKTLPLLTMPSHKPKPAHPTQALPPRGDSPTLHSDLPQQALPE